MGEPTDSADRIEYAVRYEAPAEFAGIVAHIRSHKSIAEGMARQEMQRPGGELRCTVVRRTASFTEWESADTEPERESDRARADRNARLVQHFQELNVSNARGLLDARARLAAVLAACNDAGDWVLLAEVRAALGVLDPDTTCEHGVTGAHRHGGDSAGLALRCPGPSTPESTSGGTP